MEDLRKQFETNFFGAVRLIQAVLPSTVATGAQVPLTVSYAGLVSAPVQIPIQ